MPTDRPTPSTHTHIYTYAHPSTHTPPTHHKKTKQIALSTLAMVLHGLAQGGALDLLAASGKAAPGLVSFLSGTLLPALVLYNATVNFPNVLRQSCLVVRAGLGLGGHVWMGAGLADALDQSPLANNPTWLHQAYLLYQPNRPALLTSPPAQSPLNHQVISTYCHYYGDVPERDVFFQTQILDHPLLYPFQLFCFNFGASVCVHMYMYVYIYTPSSCSASTSVRTHAVQTHT